MNQGEDDAGQPDSSMPAQPFHQVAQKKASEDGLLHHSHGKATEHDLGPEEGRLSRQFPGSVAESVEHPSEYRGGNNSLEKKEEENSRRAPAGSWGRVAAPAEGEDRQQSGVEEDLIELARGCIARNRGQDVVQVACPEAYGNPRG